MSWAGTTVWGNNLSGNLFGLGRGQAPSGNFVTSYVTGLWPDIMMSVPIMAGFMGLSNERTAINQKIAAIYDTGACVYSKERYKTFE